MSKLSEFLDKELEQFYIPTYKTSDIDKSLTKKDMYRIAFEAHAIGFEEGLKRNDSSNRT